MICENYTFMVSPQCGETQPFEFLLDPTFDIQPLNSISVQSIYIPKTWYQIQTHFEIQIDGQAIQFGQGNITFGQLITKLQKGVTNDYAIIEYLSDTYMNTGKIKIRKISSDIQFPIVIPSNRTQFFGELTWDNTEKAYISSQICNILSERELLIRSSGCLNLQQQSGAYNVLFTMQTSTTGNMNFIQQTVPDITQVRRMYTKARTIQIWIEDASTHEEIIFNSCASMYIQIVIFRYEYKLLFSMQRELDIIKQLLALKYNKPQIQSEQEQEQENEDQ